MDTILVAFGHKARHGKDTAVKAIIDKFGSQYDIRRYSFADGIKRELEGLNQFEICWRNGIKFDSDPDMTDPLCPKGKQSALLQYWGQMKREEDPFYWVNKLRASIAADQPQIALISDMRALNELLYVKSMRGYTVKVTRQGFVDLSRDPNHVSETALDRVEFDYEISVLEGQVEQLKLDACEIFQMIVDAQQPNVDAIAA
jgi:hypothetical protein